MNIVTAKLRNAIWKSVDLLPISHRLSARCVLMRNGISDFEPEWHAIPNLGPNQGTALDIGANRGFYSLQLASYYSKVIAFEPNAEVTKELKSCRRHQIEVCHTALSDVPGQKTLHIPFGDDGTLFDGWASFDPENMPGRSRTIDRHVETSTLDSLGLKDVRFIKLDVEGHELEVIRGARELLRTNRPTVLAEARQRNLASFIQLMHEAGLEQSDMIKGSERDMYLFVGRDS